MIIDTNNATELAVNTTKSAPEVPTTDTPDVQNQGGDFASFFERALGGVGKSELNEEELFAEGIGFRLSQQNAEAAEHYMNEKGGFLNSMRRPDGYVSVEDAANAALTATVEAGLIDRETAARVKSEATLAAQLDDNPLLYDGQGSENDPTIAKAEAGEGLSRAQAVFQQIDNGELDPDETPLDDPTEDPTNADPSDPTAIGGITGEQQLDGADGFLWKAKSESDGNLVVLMPNSLIDENSTKPESEKEGRQTIASVEIHSDVPASADTLLATGRFSGDEHNGARAHYRFDKEGAEYGSDIYLVAKFTDGRSAYWSIPEGGSRQD